MPNPRNLADVLLCLDADGGLDSGRRRAWHGGIRTISRILGRLPGEVPATPQEVEGLLRQVPRARHGLSDKTVANARSRLKAAIRHVAGLPPQPPRGAALSPRWRALHERLGAPRLRAGLSRLIRLSSAAGVEPDQVSDDFVAHIAQQAMRASWRGDVLAFRRQVANCWNEAAATIPGWPAIRLTVPPAAERPARLPLEAFPPSFQRDVERYLAWAADSGRLARDGSPRSVSAGTLRLRREHLRLAASALARRLGYTRRVISLAVLVEPANFRQILAEYLDGPGERRPGTFVQGMAVTLFGVARQWVRAPASQLDQLGQFKRRLGSRPAGLAEKNRRAIAPFEDPAVLADLLDLPARLLARAGTDCPPKPRSLQALQVALAIELMLAAPMRLQQLAALRIGHELRWPSGPAGPLVIAPAAGSASRERPLEYPITGHTRRLVDAFLDRCHRHIEANPERHLFVRADGKPVKPAALRDGIAREVRRSIGVALTPSQFRHLAAALVLRERPGDIGMVRDLLGHASARTTLHLYAGMGTRGAARVYGELLERARSERKVDIASHASGSSPTRS